MEFKPCLSLLDCMLPLSHFLSHISPHHQVKKTHTGIRPASERCREDPSEWQTIPRLGVRPRGAQEAHHVLHWRSGPPWAATTSHCLRAHPSLHQVTNSIIFSDGARLLLALPGQSMTWSKTPKTLPSRPVAAGLAVLLLGGHVASPMYHRDIRLKSLCYVATRPWISLWRKAKSREDESEGDPWPLASLTEYIGGEGQWYGCCTSSHICVR